MPRRVKYSGECVLLGTWDWDDAPASVVPTSMPRKRASSLKCCILRVLGSQYLSSRVQGRGSALLEACWLTGSSIYRTLQLGLLI